jgi:hypothetical protein
VVISRHHSPCAVSTGRSDHSSNSPAWEFSLRLRAWSTVSRKIPTFSPIIQGTTSGLSTPGPSTARPRPAARVSREPSRTQSTHW